MTFDEFKMYGEEQAIPYCVIRLTWHMHPEYHSCPPGEKYIMRALWQHFRRHTPPEIMVRYREWDQIHVSDNLLEGMALSVEIEQWLKNLKH